MRDVIEEMKTEAIKDATNHIRTQKDRYRALRWVCVCLTVLLCTAMICGTVFGLAAFREQQYALNMQYAGLLDYVNGATVYGVETEDGNAIIIDGNNNTTEGNYNGESNNG